MFYVYFLKSTKNGDIYIGSCEDIAIRLTRHNGGKVKSTKGYRPWKLLSFQIYNTRSEAVEREHFFKTGQQRALLKNKYSDQ